jgi:hypothetical protein
LDTGYCLKEERNLCAYTGVKKYDHLDAMLMKLFWLVINFLLRICELASGVLEVLFSLLLHKANNKPHKNVKINITH